MGEIERIATDLVAQYVEQIRPFTDRIAQLEASRECMKKEAIWYAQKVEELEASNVKLKEAVRLLRRGLREEADKVLEE